MRCCSALSCKLKNKELSLTKTEFAYCENIFEFNFVIKQSGDCNRFSSEINKMCSSHSTQYQNNLFLNNITQSQLAPEFTGIQGPPTHS